MTQAVDDNNSGIPLPPEAQEVIPTIDTRELDAEQKKIVIVVVLVFVLLLIVVIACTYFLMNLPGVAVARIRDIFIIYMALVSILVSLALVIMMAQLARLLNLLQNEIKPIVESTNETVSNLRGTTAFLSENMVEPVIRANVAAAGLIRFFQVIGLARKPSKKTTKGE